MLPATSFLLLAVIALAEFQEVNHSLIYYYTELAKDLSQLGFHEFSVLGLLDGWKIFYYDSKNQVRQLGIREDLNVSHTLPKTEELQWLRAWLRQHNEIVTNCTWPCPDLHVLQRRYGCEVKEELNGSVNLLRAIEEYGYDGEDFITFEANTSQWKAEVPKAQNIKMIWDKEKGHMQHIKSFLKIECKEHLSQLLLLTRRQTVYFKTAMFAKKFHEKNKLVVTCLATGFYPKDVKMSVMKVTTSLPEHLLTSSGVRPNDDGTFQLRKSLEVQEGETEYSCLIEHKSLKKPMTVHWDWQSYGGESWHRWVPGIVAIVPLFILMSFILSIVCPDNTKETEENKTNSSSTELQLAPEEMPQSSMVQEEHLRSYKKEFTNFTNYKEMSSV